MGMFGAGFATITGYFVSFALFLYLFYYKGDTFIKIDLKHFSYDKSIFMDIVKLAVPIVLNGMIVAIIGILINYGLHVYASEYAVAAYVVLIKIQSTAHFPMQGLSKGLCIVVGHLNGAKRFETLKYTIKRILVINLGLSSVIGVLMIILNFYLVSIFTNDPSVILEAEELSLLVCFSLITYSCILTCDYSFVGLEKSSYSFYFLLFEILMSLFLMFIFSEVFNLGGFGVVFSVLLSEAIQSVLMFFVLRFKIDNQIENNSGVNTE